MDNKTEISDLKERIKELEEILAKVKRSKMSIEQKNIRLNVDLKKKDDQAKGLFKRLKKYEKI